MLGRMAGTWLARVRVRTGKQGLGKRATSWSGGKEASEQRLEAGCCDAELESNGGVGDVEGEDEGYKQSGGLRSWVLPYSVCHVQTEPV